MTGTELRALRKSMGMFQDKFAKIIGIATTHVSRLENERVLITDDRAALIHMRAKRYIANLKG